MITVVERPDRPVVPNPRGRVRKVLLGLILGGVVGVVVAFMRAFSERVRSEGGEEYRDFSAQWDDTWSELKSLGGLRRRS